MLRLKPFAFLFLILSAVSSADAGAKPNILFILTDDQSYESVSYMKNLEELLAKKGAVFTNFFVTTSLCCPSRSSILRGQYVHNHRIRMNSPVSEGGFPKYRALGHEKSSLPVWLKKEGYETALIGKYMNGYPGKDKTVENTYIPPGWDHWHAFLDEQPFYGYVLNENGTIRKYGNKTEDYSTDVFARKAIAFLMRRSKDKPFFLHLSVTAPHSPHTPADRHKKAYPGLTYPKKPSFNEEDMSDKPAKLSVLAKQKHPDKIDSKYRKYVQSLLAVDEMIKYLVSVLEETGELENTYIFFTSDNGYHMGEHRIKAGKNTHYEEDIRVPFIVRGPGIRAGERPEFFALNTDIAPTIAELAGAERPSFIDGRSLAPLLTHIPSKDIKPRKAFLVEHWFLGKTKTFSEIVKKIFRPDFQLPTSKAIRGKDFIYVEFANGEREYYDLKKDPYQLENIAGSLDSEKLKYLSEYLAKMRKCRGAECEELENNFTAK